MTEQTRIDPKLALEALEQAFTYYQPEPVLVQADAADQTDSAPADSEDGFAYYHAA